MSRLFLIAVILLSVALNASAQILLRWGARSGLGFEDGATLTNLLRVLVRPGIFGGLACYAISVAVWVYVLSRVEASFAYPFLGLGFVFVALASWQLLGEPLTPQRLGGTLLVGLGVVVLATS
ncbi:EamA family transporter [Xanthobacter sp. VTT E-85241]|uniref:EamA family transporter n=1 Tax=Roseixanthobacter finlandensis TaxID=3119922 RepID=UPI003728E3E6